MLRHTFCEWIERFKHGWKFSRFLILFTLGAYCMLKLCYDTVGMEEVSENSIQFMNCIASATLHFFWIDRNRRLFDQQSASPTIATFPVIHTANGVDVRYFRRQYYNQLSLIWFPNKYRRVPLSMHSLRDDRQLVPGDTGKKSVSASPILVLPSTSCWAIMHSVCNGSGSTWLATKESFGGFIRSRRSLLRVRHR